MSERTTFGIARAINATETSADLLTQAAQALSKWDREYDAERDLTAARELHFKALSLRVLLETEERERVLH